MTDQSDFINYFGPISNDVALSTGLDPSMVLGTIAQETGWGRHVGNNNPFGISPGGIAATYPSLTDGARAYVDLVNRNYRPAAQQNGPDAQAHAMAMLGYNPHPDYGPAVAQRAAEVRDQGFNAPSDDELRTMTQKLRSGVPGTIEHPSEVVPTDKELETMTQKLRPPAATPAATSSPNGPQAENWGIPTGGPATTTNTPPSTDMPDLPAVLGNAYYNGPKILTPERQAIYDQRHPWIGAVTHEGDALLGSANALWQGTLYGVAKAGDAILGSNSGGSFGRDLAGMLESETARRMVEAGGMPPRSEVPLASEQPPTTPNLERYSNYASSHDVIDALDKRNNTPASGRQTTTPALMQGSREVLPEAPVDNMQYVPGTATPLAQREPTPQNIAKYNLVNKNTPAMAAAQEADNAARVDYARTIDTSASTEAKFRATRRQGAASDLRDAWENSQPVDVQPIVDHINQTLTSGINKRPVIAGPLQEVLGRLYNTAADGTKTLESDPQTLYHVRQSINDMLDRSNPNNAGNIQARAQLTEVGKRLDDIIQAGTDYGEPVVRADTQFHGPTRPGYQVYRENYADKSKPINEIEALRDAGYEDLTAHNGTMTLGKVQKVLDNLIDGMKSGDPTDNARSVSDEAWHTLFNLRDDLARKEAIINPTSGNIKPGAQPPAPVTAGMEGQLRPGVVKRGLTYAGEAAADLLSNHLVSGGVLGPFAGTLSGMASGIAANKLRGRMARNAGEAQLMQWTNDLMRMHPEWGGSQPIAGPPNPLLGGAVGHATNALIPRAAYTAEQQQPTQPQ